MSKSLYVIGGLGLGSCLVLSLMMQHLLEVKQDRDRPAVVIEIEQLLGNRLVGPAAMTRLDEEGRSLEVRLKILAGLDKEKVARSAGNIVWLRHGLDGKLEKVAVVVRDEDGASTEEFDIPRPFRSRSPAWQPVQTPPPQRQEGAPPAATPTGTVDEQGKASEPGRTTATPGAAPTPRK